MIKTLEELGLIIKIVRQTKNMSQEQLAEKCSTNRSAIAHLEQARRLPAPHLLRSICEFLQIPQDEWLHFSDEHSAICAHFEQLLSELVGVPVDASRLEPIARKETEEDISELFSVPLSSGQSFDLFNQILVAYGIRQVSRAFFDKYLDEAFRSIEQFQSAIERYQKDAIRIFATFHEAFESFNAAVELEAVLRSIAPKDLQHYRRRRDWDVIEEIDNDRLPYLGYISAKRVEKEAEERQHLKDALIVLADELRKKSITEVLAGMSSKKKARIDSLLRKFGSSISHGVSSPLFAPDPDQLEREANRIAPKSGHEIAIMKSVQAQAQANLAHYLTADYLDVYVATSMRSDGDFVSVNNFVKSLFSHKDVRDLRLRYFNPTQSWIEDRVAKGLVEALMLRRSCLTIYMAQKGDTFGKDSEASVALGQGKPVIVYVPKISYGGFDTEELASQDRKQLKARWENTFPEDDVDETADEEAYLSRIFTAHLSTIRDGGFCDIVKMIWADFDLYSEAIRIPDERRAIYRKWLDEVVGSASKIVPEEIRGDVVGVLVATAIRFEERAKLFRDSHPLALQVISSSGVLNGILVVRSVEQCAELLRDLLANTLRLTLQSEKGNYRLVEDKTGSTIRVISKNALIQNAFGVFYRRAVTFSCESEVGYGLPN